ncbi:MAG: FAD-dependent oxidoreductase [Deltaproteobacteria bacterium]|nr:FAD-dependent oxidoreductase [Deltaproteobacteria bacterium]
MGVEIMCDSPVDGEAWPGLVDANDAVFVATGAHVAKMIELEGSGLDGVFWGVDFLRRRALGELDPDSFNGSTVVVVGGGNVAVDAARVARRLGATEVVVTSLESAEELPAWDWEVDEAEQEEISMMHSWGPIEVIGNRDGRVAGLKLRRCTRVFDSNGMFNPIFDDSETTEVAADSVILAIGQDPSSGPFESLGLSRQGTINHSEDTMATGNDKVWTGGDVASGPSSFIQAVAMGRAAAADMDKALGGDGDIGTTLVDRNPVDQRIGKIDGFSALERIRPVTRPGPDRVSSFDAIEETLEADAARSEAMRCLNCDLRLAIEAAPTPPTKEPFLEMTPDIINGIPGVEGVFQLLDAERNVIAIKGAMDLKQGLMEALEDNESAAFFVYEEDPMFTKRESELIQRYLQEHGELPGGDDDELW